MRERGRFVAWSARGAREGGAGGGAKQGRGAGAGRGVARGRSGTRGQGRARAWKRVGAERRLGKGERGTAAERATRGRGQQSTARPHTQSSSRNTAPRIALFPARCWDAGNRTPALSSAQPRPAKTPPRTTLRQACPRSTRRSSASWTGPPWFLCGAGESQPYVRTERRARARAGLGPSAAEGCGRSRAEGG